MNRYVRTFAAALLFAGAARAADATQAPPASADSSGDQVRLRDGTGDGVPDRDRDRLTAPDQDRLRDHSATPDRDRVRDGSAAMDRAGAAADPAQQRARAGERMRSGSDDALRERARERMHEALAEHAPGIGPMDPAAGAAARDGDRARERAREEKATRTAERHAQRAGAGEMGRHHDGDPGAVGAGHAGMGSGECCDAACQQRTMQMRDGMGGTSGMGGGGMSGGGSGGMGTH